jgi:transposase
VPGLTYLYNSLELSLEPGYFFLDSPTKRREGRSLHRRTAPDRCQPGLRLEVIKHHEAKRGFVLLPRRWVVERSFAWAARFRRLARDYERLASTLAGYHWLAFALLMLQSLRAISA